MSDTTAAPRPAPRLVARAAGGGVNDVRTAADLRRARARRVTFSLGIFVLAPTLVAALYYGLVASDQYESVSTFTVQSSDGRTGGGLATLLGTIPGGPSDRDVLLVRDFVLSREMLQQLESEHNFKPHYAAPQVDWWSRLDADADSEERFEYYHDQISLTHDTQSGALTLKLRAFSSQRAQDLAKAVLTASETMVNRLSERARRDGIAYAQRELDAAQKRLAQARNAVLKAQSEGGQLNPLMSAEELSGVLGSLEGQLAEARTTLRTKLGLMQPDAPEVREARSRVSALQQELARQNARLVGQQQGGLSKSIAQFEPLLLEKEFAAQAVQSTLASLELARVEASRQHRYLVTIAPPSQPSEATHPLVIRRVLTVLLTSLVLLGIGALLIGSIREHGKF